MSVPIPSVPIRHAKDEQRVTIAYELVRRSDPSRVAQLLHPTECDEGRQDPCRGCSRTMADLQEALLRVHPMPSSSLEGPYDIGDPELFGLMGTLSWPRAMGLRIRMPFDAGTREWDLAAAMLMSHVYHGLR